MWVQGVDSNWRIYFGAGRVADQGEASDVAGENVLDSMANPAMAILGFLIGFEEVSDWQPFRKASMKSAERVFINFETIIKKYLTKDITFINK